MLAARADCAASDALLFISAGASSRLHSVSDRRPAEMPVQSSKYFWELLRSSSGVGVCSLHCHIRRAKQLVTSTSSERRAAGAPRGPALGPVCDHYASDGASSI
ncbi:hypothetical protein EVAR_9357_1 [Eumeta japonica]|uniref:Uncharacterized protein n=1 Tax=Eumeta variegata TaxID=151549 RepID=A0A4C1YUL4_EUMVA|nr:hypothetical protein EVAR_9357_1 [Eumeta japonica]